MTLRKGCVYFKNDLAGMIEETDSGYCFTYDTNFLNSPSAHPISVTLTDFDSLAQHFGLQDTVTRKLYKKLYWAKNDIFETIENGYLPADFKIHLKEFVEERVEMFNESF